MIARPGSAEVIDEHATHVPAAPLRGLVEDCVAFRQAGVAPTRHRGLPSSSMTLIFTLDDPLVLAAHPDPAQPPGVYQTLVAGLHTAPALITHDGRQSGIQLGVSPLGARALLGFPAGELADCDVPGDDVLGPLAAEVQDRLRSAPTWADRFAILDDVLTARAAQAASRRGVAVSAEVRHAWRRLQQTGGRASVSQLTAETGWSDRHLRSRFREETGLAPKAAARVMRFERARWELQQRAAAREALRLAELAAAFGYFDQAHLDRDFGLLAGCSPTTWVAEEFRNIQARAG